jgi:antitoxin ParD1/3/4
MMNISLTPQLESFVTGLVDSGAYQSNSEVMRCALRMLREQKAAQEAKLDALRKEINVGLDALDRGERVPAAEAFAQLRKNSPRKPKAVSR